MNDVDPSPQPPGAPAAEADAERTAAMPVLGGEPAAGPGPEPGTAAQPGEKPPSSDWFAPRRGSTNGAGIPSPAGGTQGAGIPSPGDGTDGAGIPAPMGGADGSGPYAGTAGAPGQPYFSETDRPDGPGGRPHSALSDLAGETGPPAPAAPNGYAPQGGGAPRGGPSGATSGPATGTMPVLPRQGGERGPSAAPAPAGGGQGAPQGSPAGAGPRPELPARNGYSGGVPGGLTAGLAGQAEAPAPAAPRRFDDTAVLTPQLSAAERAADGSGGNVSGSTLTSGIPVVPAEHRPAFPSQGGPGGPEAAAFPAGPAHPGAAKAEPAPAPAPASRPAPPPARKGRSKLVLAGVAVVVLGGIAYGAGLLLNHSEVPKSTMVLGVNIGGGTKEQAVVKLEKALGKRAATPLQLTVGGKKEQLAPDKAGLVLDSQATVRKAAGSDYNPVSVIGSLFGGERVVEPEIPVDEEKLGVALKDLAGQSGSAVEGTIRFEPNKVIAVPGKPGKSLDVARSMISVKDAFRAQVETGRPNVVELPVAAVEPTVGQAEIDRAMKEFAEPAMSGLITIQAGGTPIQFGPAKSLPRILSMKAINGKLVEVYDKKAIEELIGGTFTGVMITKGDGNKHQLGPDDIAQAMGPLLRGKTPQERTLVMDLDPG